MIFLSNDYHETKVNKQTYKHLLFIAPYELILEFLIILGFKSKSYIFIFLFI